MLCVDINDLYFEYGELSYPVLKNLNMQIYRADRIGLVGKNGSGKSTLFKLILNEDIAPQKGHINIAKNVRIGYLPQQIRSKLNLTADDYIYTFNHELLKAKNILSNPERFKEKQLAFAFNT